ncbi:MAG: proprotein convertase P-domain-containing protein [Phycisphaerae bacterium]|jgi:hypothetical protein|nr:proprotein convertase P-domain-containing protein [Phycisphaerae bacterium]
MARTGFRRGCPLVAFGALAAPAAALLFAASVAQAGIYNGIGGFLPDAPDEGLTGVASFVINVGDAGQVGSFNSLTITGFNHVFLGDLGATLTAPDGTVITLFERIGKTNPDAGFGDSSNFLGTYAFANGGSDIWAAAASVPGSGNVAQGTYFASAGLTGAAIDLQAAFGGKNAFGNWTLTITDYSVGEAGAITGWSLNMGLVPAPSAAAMLVGAFASVGRRRRR